MTSSNLIQSFLLEEQSGEEEQRGSLKSCCAWGQTGVAWALREIILMFSLILQFISLASWASKMFSLQQTFVQERCVNSERLWVSTNWLVPLGTCKSWRQGLPHPWEGSQPLCSSPDKSSGCFLLWRRRTQGLGMWLRKQSTSLAMARKPWILFLSGERRGCCWGHHRNNFRW